MTRMKAAVLTAPKTFEVAEVDLPKPAPDEVLLRLEGCGVCASNLANWEGMPWTKYPMEPGAMGHEGWGIVEAVGSEVTGVKVNDRVAALAYKSYAEFDTAKGSHLIKLPKSLNGQAFPGEAIGCALNIFMRSQIEKGQTVAIVGVGFLGAILTRLAVLEGAHVVAISRRPFSLDLARKMGAHETIAMDDHWRIIEESKRLTDGKLFNRVIEAVGKQWPLDLSAEITGERGRLVIAGYHQDGPRQVNMQLWNWRGFDVVNAHERDSEIYLEGIREAVKAVDEKGLDLSSILTHHFPLEKIGEAMESTSSRPDGFLKALVRYG